MSTLRIDKKAVISDAPQEVADALRRSDSIALFPGVLQAAEGIPGIRVEARFMAIHERLLLTRRRPLEAGDTLGYRFGIEGGKWVTGTGAIRVQPCEDNATVNLQIDVDMPRWASLLPGARTLFGFVLSLSANRWLRTMRKAIETRRRYRSCTFSLVDVGA